MLDRIHWLKERGLFSPRWLALTAVGLCAMVVCGLLAQWQWERAELRSEANDRIASPSGAVPIDAVLPAAAGLDDDDRWTLAEATGSFDSANEVVVRARTNDGVNGFEIVTPLVLDDGTALLVDRGFIAADGSSTSAPDYPAAPDGIVTVTGRLYESEPSGGNVTFEDGTWQARRISLQQLGEGLDYELRAAWIGELEPAEGFRELPTPTFRAWQNYSYTVQWALFAALIPVGWVVLVRKELAPSVTPESISTVE